MPIVRRCIRLTFRDPLFQPVTWYDREGNTKLVPPLDEYVYGENEYSLSHLDLKPTTWEVCNAYFEMTMAEKNGLKKINEGHKYWCWILPLKVEGGQAKLVATDSLQSLHIPFPINAGTSKNNARGRLLRWDLCATQVKDQLYLPTARLRRCLVPTDTKWTLPSRDPRSQWKMASPLSKLPPVQW